ncbi:T-cell surface glycoprotein CD1a-like [Phoca vitulina]|uniref:T-cell surface glycoprotein CD1a-like n=1 Tax=Phoca vitulina TaxID=9720 RepID=UPI001396408C|nr:T-cell surface glycoprotein CD1a-like [Phoca vitulina]
MDMGVGITSPALSQRPDMGFFLMGTAHGKDYMNVLPDHTGNLRWPEILSYLSSTRVCTVFNQYLVFDEIVHKLLSDSCPRFLLGLLDAGKAYLQRQMRPEAWLSTGPSPGPGRLLLVCHVSGFYPKPVWVMWMWGEQEQQGTQRGDLLPHADGTWYLQVSLDVKSREAAGLSCRVRHSSLGGQDMVLYWEQPHSMGLVFLAVTVLLVLLAGLALWLWKRCPTAVLPKMVLQTRKQSSSHGSKNKAPFPLFLGVIMQSS